MRKFIHSLFILLFIGSGICLSQTIPSDSGYIPFVGNRTLTFTDSSRSNRNISSLVYYPATSEGSGTPVLQGSLYPVISFGHGFTLNPNLYVSLYRHLASWGFIVIAPSTETGLFPNHLNFAKDLVFVLKDIKRKGRTPGDLFYQVIDTVNSGVFGHSMGGGCSFLAGSLDSNIRAVSSLAAATTNPSSVTAASNIKNPVQLLSGQRDSIASYWTNQIPHYNSSSPFRQIVNIKGGNHSQFHLLPGFDDLVDNAATISRPEQQRITRFYVTSFFNMFLKNDTAYKKFLYSADARNDTSVLMKYNNLGLNVLLQGFYNSNTQVMNNDSIKLYLRKNTSPYFVTDSSAAVVDDSGYCVFSFTEANNNENYFIQVSHRNSVETWSSSGAFIFSLKNSFYDFTSDSSSAFGNNLIRKGQRYCIFSGDVNKDGVVDLQDLAMTDNDVFNFTTGYSATDLNGDFVTDSEDLAIAENNSNLFVSSITP